MEEVEGQVTEWIGEAKGEIQRMEEKVQGKGKGRKS